METNDTNKQHDHSKTDYDVVQYMRELYRQSYLNQPKVIIIEDEDFDDFDYLCSCIDKLLFDDDAIDFPFKVVTGADKGEDTMALRYARHCADESASIPPLTSILFPLSKGERHLARYRNEDMLSVATHLIAFWGGEDNATKHLIDLAKEKNIPVFVFDIKNKKQ